LRPPQVADVTSAGISGRRNALRPPSPLMLLRLLRLMRLLLYSQFGEIDYN